MKNEKPVICRTCKKVKELSPIAGRCMAADTDLAASGIFNFCKLDDPDHVCELYEGKK